MVALMAATVLAACGTAAADDREVASLSTTPAADAPANTGGTTDDTTDGTTEDTTPVDPSEAPLKFAQCMREHGIDMPDPTVTADGGVLVQIGSAGTSEDGAAPADSPDPKEFEAANKDCEHFMDDAAAQFDPPSEEDRKKMEEQALAFSKCMREHGIDMPDPQISADGGGISISVGGGPDSTGPSTDRTAGRLQLQGVQGRERGVWWPWRRRLRNCNEGRRMRRRWLLVGVVAIGAAAVGMTVVSRQPTTAAEESPETTVASETAKVKRTDLVEEEKLRGSLGFGDSKVLGSESSGTITDLPDPGTVLNQGDSPWQVDGHVGPAIFFGDLPLWRTLRSGVDDGADVAELEQNLTDLGFGTDVVVDDEFDKYTSAAIKAWQDSRGFKKTGVVNPGDVVIEQAPVRVAEQRAAVGDKLSPEILSVTGAQQVVELDVSLDKIGLLSPGAGVEIELPDDTRVDGTVATIGRAATVKQEGAAATVEVSVTLEVAGRITRCRTGRRDRVDAEGDRRVGRADPRTRCVGRRRVRGREGFGRIDATRRCRAWCVRRWNRRDHR